MTFEIFEVELRHLIEKYKQNKAKYREDPLDEASLRLEYLDKFFVSLGWDVRNDSNKLPHLKDVRIESPDKSHRSTKRVDYVFRVNGFARWVCEAKRPTEVLDRGHYQVQSYVYNLRLWLGIITNFEELHLFIVGGKPDRKNPWLPAPEWRLHFTEYERNARRIWNTLSREAVAGGSIEQFIQEAEKIPRRAQQGWLIKPRRDREVDYEFLSLLDGHRKTLAKSLIATNPGFSWGRSGLNEAVHKIIDRILFQRVCEDRDIDTYVSLDSSVNDWAASRSLKGGLWQRLVSNFGDLAITFNGGLYGARGKPPHFIDRIDVSDKWLETFLDDISPDNSDYRFSDLPVEILGSVYERFLGSIVTPDGEVKPKPEARKQGGVYYTPEKVVHQIVEDTLGNHLHGKSPQEVAKIRILDPSCGSGSFLLRAFDKLCEYHVEWYTKNPDKRDPRFVYEDKAGDLRLTTALKRQILLNSIHGVDIDPQAVEVTQLSLYLKVLEGETRETLQAQLSLFPKDTFLPDLTRNIRIGNSLVGPAEIDALLAEESDSIEASDVDALTPFAWDAAFPNALPGGFDCIIGNPPYEVLEKDRGKASWPHAPLLRLSKTANFALKAGMGGKLNLYRLFVVKALQLLRKGGSFGMILPLSLAGDISCAKTRQHFLKGTENLRLYCFPQKDNQNKRIFYEAKLSTCVAVATKASKKRMSDDLEAYVFPENSFDDAHDSLKMKLSDIARLDKKTCPIPLVSKDEWGICTKMIGNANFVRLDTVTNYKITRGEINQTVYRKYITANPNHAKLLKGAEVGPYRLKPTMSQGKPMWLNEVKFKKDHGAKHDKLQAVVQSQRIAIQRITGIDEPRRIVAALAASGTFFADSLNSIHVKTGNQYDTYLLMGILNSELYQWRFKITSTNNNVGTNELAALPFPEKAFISGSGKKVCDGIVAGVTQMLRCANDLLASPGEADQDRLTNSFATANSRVESLVFQLFGLTAQDRAITTRRLAAQKTSKRKAVARDLVLA